MRLIINMLKHATLNKNTVDYLEENMRQFKFILKMTEVRERLKIN